MASELEKYAAWKAVEQWADTGRPILNRLLSRFAPPESGFDVDCTRDLEALAGLAVDVAGALWLALGIDPANPPTAPSEPEPPPLDPDQPEEPYAVLAPRHAIVEVRAIIEDAALWSEQHPESPKAIVRIDGWCRQAQNLGKSHPYERGCIVKGGEIRADYGSTVHIHAMNGLELHDTTLKCAESAGIHNNNDFARIGDKLIVRNVKIDGGWDFIADGPSDWNTAGHKSLWGVRVYAMELDIDGLEVFGLCKEHGLYDSDGCWGRVKNLVVHDVGGLAFQDRNTKHAAEYTLTILDSRSWNTSLASDKADEGYFRGGSSWSWHGGRNYYEMLAVHDEIRGPEDPAVAAVLSRLTGNQMYASGGFVNWFDGRSPYRNVQGLLSDCSFKRADHPKIGNGALAKIDGCGSFRVEHTTFGPSGVREALHVNRKNYTPVSKLEWGEGNTVLGRALLSGQDWTPESF